MLYRIIGIAIILLATNEANAQATYRATYRDSVPNRFLEIQAKMQSGELSFPQDSALISLELLKWVQGNYIYSRICSPTKTRFEGFSGKKDEFGENKVSENSRNEVYSVYDRRTHILAIVNTKDGITDTICKYADEPEVRFRSTGEKKKINDWICTKYVPEQAEYRDYILWASKGVPDYVGKSYPITGVEGGIVQTEIKDKRYITLISLSKTNLEIEAIPCKEIKLARTFKEMYENYETDELFN